MGYGIIDPLIGDDNLEEIMIIGVGKPIYVFTRHGDMIKTNLKFETQEDLIAITNKIVRETGKKISQDNPVIDARLPDGSRINITMPPISTRGTTITIRQFRKDPLTIVDLIKNNTMNYDIASFLWLATDGQGFPASFLISGGTACGKTTTLNALAGLIPPNKRIITIEDTIELYLPHEHVVTLETKIPSLEDEKEIDMDFLIRNSLRQRPDVIVVGEVRGKEAGILFTALNTGHTVMGTLHSHTARETINRLINPPMDVPIIMIPALDFIIMQNRMTHPKLGHIRRITEIAEIAGVEEDNIQLNQLYSYDLIKDSFEMVGISPYYLKKLEDAHACGINEIKKELSIRREILKYMVSRNINTIDGIKKIVYSYYDDAESTIKKIVPHVNDIYG